tara:strand:- start:435 stop:620 length:186 start_codon:yes stop_codon:yes gene_type:complete
MMDNIDRYMQQMNNIDAEYQRKLDKIREEWNEQLQIYWALIDEERKKLGLKEKEGNNVSTL